MRHRLPATLLVVLFTVPTLVVMTTLPGNEAQTTNVVLEPVFQPPNSPWKIRGLGTGVQLTRPAFQITGEASYPFLSGLVDLEVNMTYQLRNVPQTSTIKFQDFSGTTACCLFQFTTDLSAPGQNSVRCGNFAGCPMEAGGWTQTCTPPPPPPPGGSPGSPSCRGNLNANKTTDTTRTVMVGGDTTTNRFSASRFNTLRDGTPITFRVLANVKDQSPTAQPFTIFDDNNGARYHFRVDTALPNGTLTSMVGPFNATTDRFLVMTNTRTPLLEFNFTDPTTGAGIDGSRIRIFHNTTVDKVAKENTTQYEKSKEGAHFAVFAYSYATGKGQPLRANTITHIGAHVVDDTGNVRFVRDPTRPEARRSPQIGNTPAFSFRGWDVAVDTLAPTIADANVTTPGNETTVAPGAQFTVTGNVTDNLVGVQTVHAILFNASRGLWSDPVLLESSPSSPHTYSNSTVAVPEDWPDAQVSVQINATDRVGNRATQVLRVLALDTTEPAITVTPIDPFVKTGPYLVRARVIDNGTGIDPSTVTLLYRVGSGAEQSRTMVNLGGGEFSGEIPDQANGAAVNYRIRARDQSGGETDTVVHSFTVDKVGPTITLSPETNYVGTGPYNLGAVIADAGAGVDEDPAPSLKWRSGASGTFTAAAMTKGASNFWGASVPDQAEGSQVHYFIEAQDTLGNAATKGTSSAPIVVTVDKTAPTFNFTGTPTTVTSPEFDIRWSGSDAVAGIASYTIQFRESTRTEWIELPDLTNTTATTYEFCAVGGRTYHFRGWATDKAGNEAPRVETPQATVRVNSQDSCVAPPNVALTSPNGGESLSGDVIVLWTAASPQFGPELDIELKVSKDKQTWTTIEGAGDLPNTGSYTWETDKTVADGTYYLQVRAVDPNGLAGSDESDATFTVTNGISDITDTDGDGLLDAWELEHFGTLSEGAKGDADDDGYLNDEEFRAGTNPADASDNPGGAPEQWNEAYWLVLALFAAVLAVTVLGFATRW